MYSFHLKIFAHSITREKKYRQFQFTILKIRIQNWIWQETESIYRRVKFFLAIQFNRSHWKMVFSKSKSETLGKLGELPMNALLLYKFMFSHLIRQMYVAESIACTKNTNKIESIIDFADSITSAEHPNNALISTFQCFPLCAHSIHWKASHNYTSTTISTLRSSRVANLFPFIDFSNWMNEQKKNVDSHLSIKYLLT